MSNQPTAAVYYDPTLEQLGVEGSLPATPASLKRAGYQFLSGDCESYDRHCVWLWKQGNLNRWYLALVNKDGTVVASALCFSSSALAGVISQFEVVGGII